MKSLNFLLYIRKDLERHASYLRWHKVMQLTDGQRQTVTGCQGQLRLKRECGIGRETPIDNQPPKQVNRVFTWWRWQFEWNAPSKLNSLRLLSNQITCQIHTSQSHHLTAVTRNVCAGAQPAVSSSLMYSTDKPSDSEALPAQSNLPPFNKKLLSKNRHNMSAQGPV